MRGFYVSQGTYPGVVHELRDGDYPICGVGRHAKQPIIRSERHVSCPRCLRIISDEEFGEGVIQQLDWRHPLERPPLK